MTPHTCSSLEGVLKDVWTENNLGWNKLMALEYDDAMKDYQKNMNRQLFNVMPTRQYLDTAYTVNVDMSPQAVRARKQRVLEMNNRLAQVKRKGKPSYRQRQKNARAARG